MPASGLSSPNARHLLLGIFERTRQAPDAPFEPERLLAFLTDPPAAAGRRVADTFGGRRRFVHFMNAVQLEAGICFTVEEWDRGFGLDDLAELVTAKMARPDRALRLAKQRLEQARRRRVADPVKVGMLALPLPVWAALAESWAVSVGLALVWTGLVGSVAAVCHSEMRYCRQLVSRTTGRTYQEHAEGT